LKSAIKHSEGLIREIEVEIPVETVEATFAEFYQKYRKELKIPGFRPGKAPLSVIKSKFSEAINEDVLDELIRSSFPKVIKELNLDVASRPTFPSHELNERSPLKYTALIEVMPVVEKVNYEGLELPIDEIKVLDPEVDAVIEHFRNQNAEIKIVDRPAGEKDILKLDLKKLEDPSNILKGEEFHDNEVDLASSLTVKEFREGLIGLKAGDEKEIAVNYPADYSDDRFAGKSLKYLCKVVSVSEKILPEISDSFAKMVTSIETMLELKLKIREDIKKQKEIEHNKWERNQISRQIVEKNQILVPEGMIQNYLDSMVEDYKKNYKLSDESVVREHYRPVAIEAIKWHLLSNRLAEQEKIEVLPTDTENWINGFAERYRMEIDKAKEILSKSGRIQEIRDTISEDKIFDFLLSKVAYIPFDKTEETVQAKGPNEENKEL
jgi:trigger factor